MGALQGAQRNIWENLYDFRAPCKAPNEKWCNIFPSTVCEPIPKFPNKGLYHNEGMYIPLKACKKRLYTPFIGGCRCALQRSSLVSGRAHGGVPKVGLYALDHCIHTSPRSKSAVGVLIPGLYRLENSSCELVPKSVHCRSKRNGTRL